MKYNAYVKNREARFKKAGLLKLVLDLAGILDDQALKIDFSKGDSYSRSNLAEIREEVFDDFCTICCHARTSIPPLEQELYKVHLPAEKDKEDEKSQKAVNEAREAKAHVKKQLEGNRGSKAIICRAMIRTLQLFPEAGGFRGIEKKEILAVINDNLVSLGLKPVRPDYKNRKTNFPFDFHGPSKKTKVLVFDDQLDEIIKTKKALAGWPNLKVEHLVYKRPKSYTEREAELKRAGKEILALKPQIVLMDEGLGMIEGHDVISEIGNLTENPPIFVGNTGGSSDELREVGAIGNCEKGKKLDSVVEALRYVE